MRRAQRERNMSEEEVRILYNKKMDNKEDREKGEIKRKGKETGRRRNKMKSNAMRRDYREEHESGISEVSV